MTTYYNTNDEFGMPGPWEAESREVLADEMTPTFQEWADQAWVSLLDQDAEGFEEADPDYQEFLAERMAELRSRFIAGLAECATLGQWTGPLCQIAHLMDDEIRESLHSEGPGDPQAFLDAYCERHLAKFGEHFQIN